MTKGIHHISAIASNAQKTVDFYSHTLGLRLVKQTVNQDDPRTYHLFFGDRTGAPGMDMTFFIFLPAHQGALGNGQVSKVSFSIPFDALGFWKERFERLHIPHQSPHVRFGNNRLVFYDPDHLELELVESMEHTPSDMSQAWITKEISKEHAIFEFYSATLKVDRRENIEPIITEILGYTKMDETENLSLYTTTASSRAHLLEILETPSDTTGVNAAGTVHHIAFRADDEIHQLQLRDTAMRLGLNPTDVIDRFYFKSVYYRTPAGILFEIATDGPGFMADQTEKDLGLTLSLPPFLQPFRSDIEKNLPKLNT